MFHNRRLLGAVRRPFAGGANTTTGLVSYWAFSEGSGTNVADTGSAANPATVSDTSQWGTGYYHLGIGNTASAPKVSAYNFGSAMTGFMWVRGASGQVSLFFASQYDISGQAGWTMGTGPSGNEFRVVLSADGASSVRKAYIGSQTCLDSSNWHSICFVWNAGTLNLYVDGVKDTSVTKVTDDSFSSLYNTTSAVFFGGLNNGGTFSGSFSGDSQRARLYNVAKTDTDVAAIHALGHA